MKAHLDNSCPMISREEGDHPLQTAWAFWYDKKQAQKTDTAQYRGQLQKVVSFDTLEGFWKLYCHLKRPSTLEVNMNFHLFRDAPNHAPMWEAYPRGGCWVLRIKKKKECGFSLLGKIWQDIVLAAVGENFDEPDVCGISLCIRRNEDLLSVWNADNRNDEVRFKIGEKMKFILDLEPQTIIEYKHHSESMQDMSTFRNAKAYVFAAQN
ncbi:eukaryotic initiation factor 4E putative [Ochromonadaceae sp. CCMP2298]|nr:eukaryotic initiation factor 4E putative [Ochromonadaceae sp. CCMP2298]|mmetsp:Transcript_7123/g.15577  ORF Transcript_7123/g.15577 Transcript_7123/m.15577 type:complete len:209 (-) Transcript_7123:124-750(-)